MSRPIARPIARPFVLSHTYRLRSWPKRLPPRDATNDLPLVVTTGGRP